MKGIDTNILVRFLIGDDKVQTKIVYKIFKNAELLKTELFVPLLVVLELIWVLESVYEISRKDIIDSIDELLLLPILQFEHQSILQQFVKNAYTNNCDLSDLLISHTAQYQGCEVVLTFDKKASKHRMFKLAK